MKLARSSIRARLLAGGAVVLLAFPAGAGFAVQRAHAERAGRALRAAAGHHLPAARRRRTRRARRAGDAAGAGRAPARTACVRPLCVHPQRAARRIVAIRFDARRLAAVPPRGRHRQVAL
ncbi:hypothetical protein HK414_23675 [Ramlibacter terrae]|uniref:Uncharacterized protein n=1 Tax=Ramlibacter terrae TaxID=2732511 RepID=A0ABX6P5D5_9BURK|nr:hypothetical protein HK414_23675 [Ramlibacter terrae]